MVKINYFFPQVNKQHWKWVVPCSKHVACLLLLISAHDSKFGSKMILDECIWTYFDIQKLSNRSWMFINCLKANQFQGTELFLICKRNNKNAKNTLQILKFPVVPHKYLPPSHHMTSKLCEVRTLSIGITTLTYNPELRI